MTRPRLHGHHILTTSTLPPYVGPMFEYWLHGGGLAVRAERTHLRACIPFSPAPVRGLPALATTVELALPRVPSGAVALMLDRARAAQTAGRPSEILFHLSWGGERWRLDIPAQTASATRVQPTAGGPGSSYATALIELHSHHTMPAFWSGTDDADEQGFRLYAVLGTVFTQPTLRLRVGVYGVFYEIDPAAVFALPPEFTPYREETDR